MSSNRRRTLDATSAAKSPTTSKGDRRRLTSVPVTKTEAVEAAAGEVVKVVVPKAFNLVLDHHHEVKYPAGTYDMPIEHAENWWSVANGVVLAN